MTNSNIKIIDSGVCAPIGFLASGIHCGVKKGRDKKDLAIIKSENLCNAAAVFTTNVVKAAPVLLSKKHLANGLAQAVIVNSGVANACVADGYEKASVMAELAASSLKVKKEDVIVASTGVIGQSINLVPIKVGAELAANELSRDGNENAIAAIMTTDTFPKQIAVEFMIDDKTVRIGGICKGSGMINPNMATMLGFLMTDAKVDSNTLSKILKAAADVSFNRVSVDGDTSTNDMLCILANGKSGAEIKGKANEKQFVDALNFVCVSLAKLMAKDGEGATKLLECEVIGASNKKTATLVADSVIKSPLVKTAMFGEDANWGRILCAAGYSTAEFDPLKVDIFLESKEGKIQVCAGGGGLDFCEELAAKILKANEIKILVDLKAGVHTATSWGCDLSYDYVKINGDYRS